MIVTPAWLRSYMHADDPRIAACNAVAMLVGWNQPCYPFYLWWIVGPAAWVGAPASLLSAVAFCAVPWMTRRYPTGGRIGMVLVSVVSTVLWTTTLGEAAGNQLYYFPCAMVAAIVFRWRQRLLMLGMTALPLAAWLLTRSRLDLPPIRFPPEQAAQILSLNAVSAGCLMVFMGWLLAGFDRPR